MISKLFQISLIALAALASPVAAQPVEAPHLTVELVSQSRSVTPGGTVFLAVHQKLEKGWHTYWRNPGDAGEAPKLAWQLPQGWSAGAFVWPKPEIIRVGPLLDYAYHDEVLLPVPIEVPASARDGETVTLEAVASFLVCKETCIPADADLKITLPVSSAPPQNDPRWFEPIARTLADAPRDVGLKARFTLDQGRLKLSVASDEHDIGKARSAYFFPYGGAVIKHADDQIIAKGTGGLSFDLAAAKTLTTANLPYQLEGIIAVDDQAYEISANQGAMLADTAGAGSVMADPGGNAGAAGLSVWLAAVYALLGGLILNLMPCVLPVLSLKAAGLIEEAGSPARVRLHGLAFAAGAILSFLLLAGLLVALKSAGAAIGWGFHLQSAPVTGALALLMVLVGLNLSGLFEVGSSLQSLGAGHRAQGGVGAFLTGVLAVAVAAPCTAPFMGVALGFALTQPVLITLIIFLALGIGFSAPFLLIAVSPGLISRLPKPGAWMGKLKAILALPMYGTALWLAWVFSRQTGPVGWGGFGFAVLATLVAAIAFGMAQRRSMSGGPAGRHGLVAVISVILAVGALGFASHNTAAPKAGTSGSGSLEVLGPKPWSQAQVDQTLAAGKPVFVDFTADWCVTCKVNEGTILISPKVVKTFKATGAAYLVADWTRRDALIATELARHGRAGVPLYLVYTPGRADPLILPQLLSEGAVIEALESAKASSVVTPERLEVR